VLDSYKGKNRLEVCILTKPIQLHPDG